MAPLSGKKLLLVTGDADLAALLGEALLRIGADVRAAVSGRGALEGLAQLPDAAVLELPLPDLSGSELLAALARANVAAIVVSGVYRGVRAAQDVRRLGARDFFEKPFGVDAVARAVCFALGIGDAPPDEREDACDEVTAALPLAIEEDSPAASPLANPTPQVRGGRRRPASPGERPPPARGELGETTVPRLLVALHLGQVTGALTLSRGPVKKILAVEQGVPVYAASNVGSERLAAICVRRGVVGAEGLETLRQARPSGRTADLLLEAGLLDPERHVELVTGQVRAIAWSTFEWRDGGYALQLGKLPSVRVPVRIPMADLVLEGMRRASTLATLSAELPRGVHLAPCPDPAFELYALALRAPEARLLTVADGTKSVGDLLRLSDLPERDALAFLQACRVMRLLDDVERVLASTRRIGFIM